MSRILIRQLGKEDWQVYREIRLHSLKQDPDSFCSTNWRGITSTEYDSLSR